MAYNTILTILAGGPNALRGLDGAIAFAAARDAHLDVVCVGLDAAPVGYSYAEVSPMLLQNAMDDAQEEADALAQSVRERLEQAGMRRTSVSPVVCPSGMLPGAIRRYARFCDLVVMPRPYGAEAAPAEASLVEGALFEAHVPALILPGNQRTWVAPRRIGIGWNEGDEALRAIRAALPLMEAADTTFITIIDPPQHGPDRSDPGGMLAQYISRHGVRCEVDVLARSLPRISDHLVRATVDRDIDLMVMGAYGRARWSEAMFGGATRDMLEHCPVPLFLAR